MPSTLVKHPDASLPKLPVEVIRQILLHSKVEDIASVALTCSSLSQKVAGCKFAAPIRQGRSFHKALTEMAENIKDSEEATNIFVVLEHPVAKRSLAFYYDFFPRKKDDLSTYIDQGLSSCWTAAYRLQQDHDAGFFKVDGTFKDVLEKSTKRIQNRTDISSLDRPANGLSNFDLYRMLKSYQKIESNFKEKIIYISDTKKIMQEMNINPYSSEGMNIKLLAFRACLTIRFHHRIYHTWQGCGWRLPSSVCFPLHAA